MFKRTLIITAAAALLAPAGALAKPSQVKYAGKTNAGTKISFVLKDGWVDQIATFVPTTCSAEGDVPKVSQTDFLPPFKFRLGYTAAASTSNPTYHYHFASHRQGKRIVGKLSYNWSILGSDGWGGYKIIICQGNASYSAAPAR